MRSVIVRLFEPAPEAGRVGLCGLVEDVRTGASWPFHGDQQLLAAVVRAAGEEELGSPGSGPPTAQDEIVETCWP